jgi:hypothetical protein
MFDIIKKSIQGKKTIAAHQKIIVDKINENKGSNIRAKESAAYQELAGLLCREIDGQELTHWVLYCSAEALQLGKRHPEVAPLVGDCILQAFGGATETHLDTWVHHSFGQEDIWLWGAWIEMCASFIANERTRITTSIQEGGNVVPLIANAAQQ